MHVHRFAIAAAVATFILTIFGGVVSVTESGLACPDWPLCEGRFFPQMVDGKQYEHSHRLVASFVAAMTFGLMALLIKYRRKQPYLVKLGILAAVLVTVQALIGAATVILRLPWAVTSSHLAVATVFFVLMTSLAFLTHPSRPTFPAVQKSLGSKILPVGLLLFFQVVGGGVMRHLRAGLACGFDLPLCNGSLWPLDGYVGVQVHMAHRLFAVLSALAMLALVTWIWRRPDASRKLKLVAALAGMGMLAQVTLGVMTVLLSREIFTINTHSSLGILLMSVVTWMYWLAAVPQDATADPRPPMLPAQQRSTQNPVEA